MKYPGSKTNSGIIQFLINRIPYHTGYYELFGGSGALCKEKQKAAIRNVICDIDSKTIKRYENSYPVWMDAYVLNAIDVLQDKAFNFLRSDFIYLDPPYPFDSRRSGKKYYRHEMTDADHVQLLETVLQLDANVMISTRQNTLYDKYLKKWRKEKFATVDRAGSVDEIIFMNYRQPAILHQYDYLGNDCWDRQGIKRKVQRFEKKIRQLPDYERHLLIMEMIKANAKEVSHFLRLQ